jgi:Tfp pilus assembly protein PilW
MKDQEGFSIVELVIAIVVGVLLILSMNFIVNNYIHLGQRGRNLTTANAYVEAKVEALRNAGYNGLNTGTTNLAAELPAQLTGPKSGTMVISQPQDGLKQIDISIAFNDNGNSRTYTYKTYVGELGVGQ